MGPLLLASCLTCKGVYGKRLPEIPREPPGVQLHASRRFPEGGKLGRGLSWLPPLARWPHRACGQPSEVDDIFGLRITQSFCPGLFPSQWLRSPLALGRVVEVPSRRCSPVRPGRWELTLPQALSASLLVGLWHPQGLLSHVLPFLKACLLLLPSS